MKVLKFVINGEEQNVPIIESWYRTENLLDYEILTNLPSENDVISELDKNSLWYFEKFRTEWHLYQSQYESNDFYLSLYSGTGKYKYYFKEWVFYIKWSISGQEWYTSNTWWVW